MSGRVLIVDDVATNRIVMRFKLASAFYDTLQAASGAEALGELARQTASVVVVAHALPDMSGADFCQKLRASPHSRHVPILMVVPPGKPGLRLAALQAGADAVLERPLNQALLLARLRGLLRASNGRAELRLQRDCQLAAGMAEAPPPSPTPAHIGVICSQHSLAETWIARLAPHIGHHRWRHYHVPDLIRSEPQGGFPDLVLIMLDGRASDPALHLVAGLKAQPATRHIVQMALLPNPNPALAAEALDHGAEDVATAQTGSAEIGLRIARLLAQKARADDLRNSVHSGLRAAVLDPLTGLYNRRFALPQLARMGHEAAQAQKSLAVMVADIDHFKAVNDRYGHAVGDSVLVEVAERLRRFTTSADLLARIGGEEFLIATTVPDLAEARVAAQMVCRAIGARPFLQPKGGPAPALPVTISVGLATRPANDASLSAQQLLALADQALMVSKTRGHNQVVLSQPAA